MKTILNILGSPKTGEIGINLLKTLFAWLMLGLCMFFPVAGWHRLYLKIPGWYWWSVAGFLALFGVVTCFLFHKQAWLLMAFPLTALFANDCILIPTKIWSKKA